MKLLKQVALLLGLSVGGALILYAFGLLNTSGRLIKWRLLGMPPEKATQVLAPRYIRTISGHIYKYVEICTDNCWQQVDSISYNPINQLSLETCGWMPDVSRYSDSISICERSGMEVVANIVAIDEQGGVYTWQSRKGEETTAINTFSPCVGAILGFGIGIIILLSYWIYSLFEKPIKQQ
jgi:hypothetical protein